MTVYFTPETLDELAECILVSAMSGRDEGGNRLMVHPNIEAAPEAVGAALNAVYGRGHWAAIGEWPRPEQMAPVQLPDQLRFLRTRTQ